MGWLDIQRSDRSLSLRRRAYAMLEREPPVTRAVSLFHRAIIVLILINIVSAVLDTVPEIHAVWERAFDAIEVFSLGVFSAEYILRLWVAPEAGTGGSAGWMASLRWMISPGGLIDLVAIVPFAADQVLDVDLRFIVLLRLLRFFKIARYSPGFHSLGEAVWSERHALMACLVILGSVILISAGLTYVVEHSAQPDKFGTIPDAMWWSIATVTTVGYGDVVPVTTAGRLIGAFTMVSGLLMLALPAGIVATSFANIIARRNFVLSAGLVVRMPLFAGLATSQIFDLLPALSTRVFEPGEYIIRKGERVEAIYVVADGQLEVHLGRRQRVLKPGDSFGGQSHSTRKAVHATTRVRLLVLDTLEAKWLLANDPRFGDRVTEPA
jgi:voltage-gated potassium channel